ncbi:L,D-transpeptidase family protein [Xiamenia xianingshaonis]|uniref:L,D-transpeptidase family protein n=1 Tax=Xiamenia xianingshaonis TaxID=2682776 RepID=UPI0021BD070D|nr:L,D-transpeptidase family protein [Xiamenia xianingshaonis]
MSDKIKNAKHGKHAKPETDESAAPEKDLSGLDFLVTKKEKIAPANAQPSSAAAGSADAGSADDQPAHPQRPQRPQTMRLPPITHQDLAPLAGSRPQSNQPMSYGMTPYGAVAPSQGMLPVDTAAALKRQRRKRSILKALGITFGVLVALVVVAYVGVAVYFSDRFMPNSTIGDVDVSLMSASEAQRAVANSVSDYELTVEGMGFTLNLSAVDTGLRINAASMVDEALSHENPWLWPIELKREHNETAALVASYNDAGLTSIVEEAVATFNSTAEGPTNASVAYDETAHAYVVTPEAPGQALEASKVVEAADRALAALEPTAVLDETALKQPEITASDERLAEAAESANKMIAANFDLILGEDSVEAVNGDIIHQWITLDDEYKATLDREAMTSWANALADSLNTVGTSRTYKRADGKTFTVEGGVYGWEVDREALVEAVVSGVDNGSAEPVYIPTFSEGAVYNGVGERDWGNRYLDVDLADQYVRLYDDNNKVIWESDCISGTPDGVHDTSTGVYWVNRKQSPSKLTGYENGEKLYDTTVQYWMPFDGNAIGLHDADWQPDFGGEMYKEGYGSHGCVNLPPDKAGELYGLLNEGDVVVSHW